MAAEPREEPQLGSSRNFLSETGTRAGAARDARLCAAAARTPGPERTRTGEWPSRGCRGRGQGAGFGRQVLGVGDQPQEVRSMPGEAAGGPAGVPESPEGQRLPGQLGPDAPAGLRVLPRS